MVDMFEHQPEIKSEIGAIDELKDVIGSEMLISVSHRAQRIWIQVYGLDLVKKELPLAFAAWATNERRQQFGGAGLFLRSWFQNVAEELERRIEREAKAKSIKASVPPPSRRLILTTKKCKSAWFMGPDGPTELLGVCSVHRSFEKCEREGRE